MLRLHQSHLDPQVLLHGEEARDKKTCLQRNFGTQAGADLVGELSPPPPGQLTLTVVTRRTTGLLEDGDTLLETMGVQSKMHRHKILMHLRDTVKRTA